MTECFHGVVVLGAEREKEGTHYDSVWRCEECGETFVPASKLDECEAAKLRERDYAVERINTLESRLHNTEMALEAEQIKRDSIQSQRDEALRRLGRITALCEELTPDSVAFDLANLIDQIERVATGGSVVETERPEVNSKSRLKRIAVQKGRCMNWPCALEADHPGPCSSSAHVVETQE